MSSKITQSYVKHPCISRWITVLLYAH